MKTIRYLALLVVVMSIGCAEEEPSEQVSSQGQGDLLTGESTEQPKTNSIVGVWKDQKGRTWAFSESRFYCDFKSKFVSNESNGTYRISGSRLTVDWEWVRGLQSKKVPEGLSRQHFEFVWLDDEKFEIEAMSKGWLTGADNWEQTVVTLERQSKSLFGSHRDWIDKR